MRRPVAQRQQQDQDDDEQIDEVRLQPLSQAFLGPRCILLGQFEKKNYHTSYPAVIGKLFKEREELEEAGVKVPDGQIGKKKMAKLQQKAEKKKVAL